MEDFVGPIIIAIGVAIGLWLLFSIVNIGREYERLVVVLFGRLQGAKGPGIVLLIPFVQQAVKVDLRERFLEVPQQTCITKDNAPINIDFLVYSKVFDPQTTVTAVTDFTGASQALAATTLRAVIGDIPLDDVLAKREEINHILRVKLDEVTERWGVKITSVEIREIVPPRDIQDAMNRQMSAERNRRAVIMRGRRPPSRRSRGRWARAGSPATSGWPRSPSSGWVCAAIPAWPPTCSALSPRRASISR